MPDREGIIAMLEERLAACGDREWATIRAELLRETVRHLKQGQVVKCADCRYYNTQGAADGLGWCERGGAGCAMAADFFCAGGKRKQT